jgi:hypothetical protein
LMAKIAIKFSPPPPQLLLKVTERDLKAQRTNFFIRTSNTPIVRVKGAARSPRLYYCKSMNCENPCYLVCWGGDDSLLSYHISAYSDAMNFVMCYPLSKQVTGILIKQQ